MKILSEFKSLIIQAIIVFYILCFGISQTSAQQAKSYEFNIAQGPTTNNTYTARDSIKLSPNFSVAPSAGNSFVLKIDNNLIFNVDYLAASSIPNLTTRTPDANLPFGSTTGSYNVSPSGAATYQIPILVPKGLGGLEPQVSIAYNSQTGNGLLGWGCNLTGLSAITRVPKNLYSDNEVKGLEIDLNDRFALDGNRLVSNAGTYGADNSSYRTENETFSHIISQGNYGKNSPASFVMYAKNGTIYKYGSQSGRVLYSIPAKNAILTWYLDSVRDVYGNTMTYTYEQKGLATYLKSITYGTNKGGFGIASIVEFFYEKRDDPINFHYFPKNDQIDQVLYKVVSKTGNQILRTYNFEYTKDAFTRLSKVTESNGSGSQLNPTYLKWGDYGSGTVNPSNYTLPTTDQYFSQVNFSQRSWTTGDVNGDGLTDLISLFPYKKYSNGGSSWTQINVTQCFISSLSSNGTTSFSVGNSYEYLSNIIWDGFNCYSSSSAVQNLNGDSKPDIVVPYLNTIENYSEMLFMIVSEPNIPLVGQSLKSKATTMPAYAIGELNNDGIEDIVFIENNQSSNYYPGKIKFGSTDWINTKNWIDFNIALNKPPKNIFIGDYNGDGLNDIMVVNDVGYVININNGNQTFTSQGLVTNIFNSTYSRIRPGDFNGDGLQDFILCEYKSTKWWLALNNGAMGFTKTALSNITADQYSDTYSLTVDNTIVTDFNNDGKSDIVIFDQHGSVIDTWWYKSTGSGMEYVKKTTSTQGADFPNKLYFAGDFNGDGRVDLMNFGYDCYGGTDMTQKWRMYATPNTNYEGGMVTSISNGLAQNIRIAYTTTATKTNYSLDGTLPSGTPTFPLAFLGNSAYLVKKVTIPNGVSSNVVQNYAYTNGIVDLQRGFMGFGKFMVTDSISNAISEQNLEFVATYGTTKYYQPFLSKTRNLVGTKVLSEASTPVSSYSITPLTNGQKHVFMYPTVTTQTDYLKNTLSTTTSSMDGDGNILTTETKTADKDVQNTIVASQKTTYNGYAKRIDANPNPYKNAPDNVVTEQTHKDTPGSKFTVTTAFTYNTNGSLKNKTDFSGTPKALLTSYTYNEVGNVLTSMAGDRTVTLEYIDDKRFVKKQFNPLNQPNQYTETAYDIWGNPVTQWDLNRLKTTIVYDAWGYATSTTSPNGQKVISSIDWSGKGNYSSYNPANCLYYTSSVDEDSHFIGAEYFDGAGHSLRKTAGGFDTRIMCTDVTYNKQGKDSTITDPFLYGNTATKTTKFAYDTYGRLKVQTQPNAVTVTTGYSDDNQRKITTTYSTGEIYTKLYDPSGLLTTATDPGGSINYTYFSTGKPKNIQPAGGAGATVITYNDTTGLQKTLTDPNTGTSTYYYTLFGELKSQTDGNNKTTYISYDKLGRIYTKKLGSVITTYYYDPAGALGLVDHISKTGGSGMSYKYDGLTRVIEETRSKNTEAFTYKYEYDGKSRVSKLTYPGSMSLTYGYNTISGDLTSISKDGTVLWSLGTTIADVNDLGQIAKVTLGNGKSTLYGYDTQNRLNSISAANIINFSYQFNNKQQLEYRDERMYNGTSMAGFKESFTYDGVNRLWTATKDNGNTPLTMVYKTGVNDRIDNKSDVGGYVYNETTNHCIDKLNTVAGYNPPQHNLTYNDEGKTSIITETNNGAVNKTLTLDYGLDGQRFTSVYIQDNILQYKRWYFDMYEMEKKGSITKQLNYIYAGSQLIAIFEQNSASGDKMHYVYTDRQGSLRCITNASGTIEQRLSFDAWGNRRNYNTGAKLTDADLAAATALISRGYSGQEHVDGLGLINMNARFYDSSLGIFISPDNYVSDPDFSQAFNRVAYGLNNPMSYIDPDGNNPVLIAAIIIGALAGGYTGYKVADAKGYNMGDWQTYGFILGGAAIGGFSGYAGATIAAGGGFMANTMGIMYSSMSYSMGMSALSGGMIQPSVSFGFGSYNFGTGEFNYLFDGDNKWYEDLGYTFGALANVQDIFAGFNGTDIKVASHNSFNLKTPHSYINGKDIDISVANRIPTNSKNMFQYAWRILTKSKYRTAGYYDVADKSKDWVVELNNVRSTTLQKITANIKNVNSSGLPDPKGLFGWGHLRFGLGFGCVQHASRSLLASGVWYVPFNPLPQILNAQLLIRQMGIYASPYLINQ